ncbi:hypothetical protein EI94DRAFT_1698653 [Lactarius quietus]|nr:hypothetical protein EI94DRAFT_1698653 [Lactarius quietus]
MAAHTPNPSPLPSFGKFWPVSSSPVEVAQYHPGPPHPSQLSAWMDRPPSLRDGSEGGRMRLQRPAFNSRYLEHGHAQLGFITYDHTDSPIVPLLLFLPRQDLRILPDDARTQNTHRCVRRLLPRYSLITSRPRFCVSASHTKDGIGTVLRACEKIGDILDVKHLPGERWSLEQIMNIAAELVIWRTW